GRALAKEDVGGFSSSTGKSYAGRQPGKRRSRAPSRKWIGMQTYARRMSQVVAGLLEGRRGLVLGGSVQWGAAGGLAQAAVEAGARVALTYQGQRQEQSVRALAQNVPDPLILPCDVSVDEQIDALCDALEKEWGRLDFLVHSIAFA